MNITDLIVELLQQGMQVELTGMGTFGSEMQPPHHNPATGTYYPASRTLTFSTATKGDDGIVQALAQRECVSENVARQMWKNYVDALTDKLQRTGSHAFGELGTLNYDAATGYSFAATPGVALSTGDEKPLEGVKTYAHNDDDPFAQFEDNSKAEEERLAAERKAEEERLEAERREAEARAEAERKAEEERLAAERKAEEERLEAERREAEARAEAERKAEEERLKAEQEAKEERAAAEAAAALAALNTKPAEAVAAEMPEEKPAKKKEKKKKETAKKKEEKKRRFPWWLLILLLLLLLLGGAAYWYFKIYRPAQPVTTTVEATETPIDVQLITDLTYNTDLLQYNQRDIDVNTDRVCRYMEDYIYSFLAYRH